ncbi:efflux RND transporter permease subunit [Pedobacter sp. PLR]|uniref:efflux RND transporter permease subunit n=1 Tax=Pedobacter sp. PLR TaxID=2994465 RepID=UPI002246CBB6|nr:efflux RND transporter permease subunit [Pedobacter sp. PLR]MCX2453400.1 efflux RND transporter permease subunit [Pedobacter sp. PLR]
MNNFFISHKKPLIAVLLLILLAGAYSYTGIKTALFPEITFPKIKIIAEGELQPVNQMMLTVTRPLENVVKQVPDLKLIRSVTSRGSCEISAYMNWNANIDLSQQRIESQIAKIKNSLPAGLNLTIEKMNPAILPVSGYTLESAVKSPVELKQLADYTIKPFLMQVEGVSEIRIIGGKTKEYRVKLNYSKMTALAITPDQIASAVAQTNFVKSNGYIADFNYLYLSVTDATLKTREDLENLIVSKKNNRAVRLKDLAEVNAEEAIAYTRVNANGKAGILIAVIKQPNANLVDLSAQMEQKVAGLRKILPQGVSIKPYYLQADFVNRAVTSVTESLWVGLVLAIVVAIFFLRSLKPCLTILFTIPVTLGLTLICLYAIGYSFNIMTLGAIAAAIGLIIDDAIVVVEQIHRTHEEHPGAPTSGLLKKAIAYLFPAMLGSSISTIVIFIPFILMTGVAGAYFQVMTNTMVITLVCSFFVTWIGLPVIYLMLTKKEGMVSADEVFESPPLAESRSAPKTKASKRAAWITFFIRRSYLSFGFLALLLLLMVVLFPRLETGFLPEMDEGSIVLDYKTPAGTSLEETDRILTEVERMIVKIPEVETYSRRTGTQMGFFITAPNTGDYLIQLKQNRNRSTNEVIDEIRSKIEHSQPALTVDFGQVIGDMLGDLMSATQPIELKIFGGNQEVLQRLSKSVAEVVSKVKGTADVFDGIVIAGPSVDILPDYATLAQYGISPSAFQLQVQTALEGRLIGNMYGLQQLYPIRMVSFQGKKPDMESLSQMNILLGNGKMIPIRMLAKVQLKTGEAEVERENLQSIGLISARLDQRDLGSVMGDIQKEISAKVRLPNGYYIIYGGAYAEQQQSFKELFVILMLSCLLVFSVILFVFKEFKIAFIILLIAIFGVSGSCLALFITQTPLNVGSYTGMIMMVGIVAENAIFTFLQFKSSRTTRGLDDALVFAISTRLRPKLMTALGAILALSPLALGIGAGAQLHQPLAISIIGGFLMAMPLLLVVLPALIRKFYQ